MKETKLLNLLEEFAFKLQEITPRSIEELKIILPYDNYKQLEYEVYNTTNLLSYNPYNTTTSDMKVATSSGITFKLSCKEIEDAQAQKKLQECYKILSK